MLLKDYVKQLNELLETHPKLAEFEVVVASDGEGDSFSEVEYEASVGMFSSSDKSFEAGDVNEDPINAVCIN